MRAPTLLAFLLVSLFSISIFAQDQTITGDLFVTGTVVAEDGFIASSLYDADSGILAYNDGQFDALTYRIGGITTIDSDQWFHGRGIILTNDYSAYSSIYPASLPSGEKVLRLSTDGESHFTFATREWVLAALPTTITSSADSLVRTNSLGKIDASLLDFNALTNISVGGKLSALKTSVAAPAFEIKGAYAGGPRLQTYGLESDGNAWMGLGTDMSGASYENSIYFPGIPAGRLTIGDYNGSTYNTRVTVLQNGHVGIGTMAPATPLEIVGATRVTGPLGWDTMASLEVVNGAQNYGRALVRITGRLEDGNEGWSTPGTARNSIVFATNATSGGAAVGALGTDKMALQYNMAENALGVVTSGAQGAQVLLKVDDTSLDLFSTARIRAFKFSTTAGQKVVIAEGARLSGRYTIQSEYGGPHDVVLDVQGSQYAGGTVTINRNFEYFGDVQLSDYRVHVSADGSLVQLVATATGNSNFVGYYEGSYAGGLDFKNLHPVQPTIAGPAAYKSGAYMESEALVLRGPAASSSSVTGALTVAGGVGVGGDVNVGGKVRVRESGDLSMGSFREGGSP